MPAAPTATNRPLPKVTERQELLTGGAFNVHVMPSALTITRFASPTATNRSLPNVTERNPKFPPDALDVQVMPSGLVISRFKASIEETATNRPLPYVTELQSWSPADVRDVHVMPSGLVITRLPVPEEATATNKPFAYVTENQLLSAADARDVHVMPSGLVITRSPVPKKAATATNKPFPYVTERQLLFVADVLDVHDSPPPGVPGTPDWAAGVTDADGVDAAEVPPALLAVAVNVYAVPFVRPDTTHAPDAPTIVHVAPPGDAVTVCDVAGHTSMASATDTLTAPSPATAPGAVGTLGFAIGVTDADAADAADVPPAFVAVAVNV